jgi:hypothetical protein
MQNITVKANSKGEIQVGVNNHHDPDRALYLSLQDSCNNTRAINAFSYADIDSIIEALQAVKDEYQDYLPFDYYDVKLPTEEGIYKDKVGDLWVLNDGIWAALTDNEEGKGPVIRVPDYVAELESPYDWAPFTKVEV